jgi:RNA polymerase sigma factor (sigma-70 family)
MADRAPASAVPTANLVAAAAEGDQRSWDQLVDRFGGLLWAIARAHRLNTAEAGDVTQTAWLRLVEHLGRLRDPEHVGAWLATTTRRECLRVLRRRDRQIPSADDATFERAVPGSPTPEDEVLRQERDALLWQTLDRLSERCRQLLRILAAVPPPSYQDVGAALDMPIGSIGPTRARCLDRLRGELAAIGITSPARNSIS